MRAFLIISTLILFVLSAKGQDTIKHFELGSTLLTLSTPKGYYYILDNNSTVKFANGLFFRYTKKRFGFRVLTSYSHINSSYIDPPTVADGGSSDINSKDFRIGFGGQFSLLKKKDWLYSFSDLLYRNIFFTGHSYGGYTGWSSYSSSTTNGLDAFFGLGFKIKIFKIITLSPEFSYNIFYATTNSSATLLPSGPTVNHNSNHITANKIAKIHLTIKF